MAGINELVEYVATKTTNDKKISKKDIKEIIYTTMEGVKELVTKDDKLTIIDFGSFEKQDYNGINPKTKKPIKTKIIKFKTSQKFKEKIKN